MFIFLLLFIFLNLSSPLKIGNVINSKFSDLLQITDNDEELIDIAEYEHINPNNPNYFYIPIFSTSDIHGHFYPDEYDVGSISYSKGGLDYLAKYVSIIKNEFKNNVIYLDAGDLFQGGTESTITDGEIIIDYLNLINANGSTFGNHEYDKNRTFIEKKVCDAKFPFLATNIYDTIKKTKKAFGENHFTSKVYTFNVMNYNNNSIEEDAQIKVGIIGLTLNMTQSQIAGAGFEGIVFLDYKEELVSEANKLREESKVNAVVLLSHLDMKCGDVDNLTLNIYKPTDVQEKCNNDSGLYKLIDSLDEGVIDAIVTGHGHREVHHWVKKIPIISPINNGYYANIMYLAFDRNNNYNFVPSEVRIEGPLPICQRIFKKNYKCDYMKKNEIEQNLPLIEYKFHNIKIEKDPILQPIHDKYDSIYSNYSEKICSIIGTDDILTIETNGSFYIGNLIADIYRYVTGSHISLVSYGNLRTELIPGKIPRFKIKDLQPFGNYFCSFTMNGKEIKKMMKIIQAGIKKYFITSGVKQIFTKNNEGEYSLANIKLFDGYKEFNLLPDKEYLISANNFLILNGGDDFYKVLSWYKPRNLNCNYGIDADLVEKFLRAQQIIDITKYIDDNNPRIRFIDK